MSIVRRVTDPQLLPKGKNCQGNNTQECMGQDPNLILESEYYCPWKQLYTWLKTTQIEATGDAEHQQSKRQEILSI